MAAIPTLLHNSTASITVPEQNMTAREYERMHTGKLMIINRHDGRPVTASDFFRIEAVATHPTGLIVTGIFENARRSHIMASAVRVADAAEVEWLRACRAETAAEHSRS